MRVLRLWQEAGTSWMLVVTEVSPMPEISIRMLEEQPTLVMWGKVVVEDMPQFLGRAYHATAHHAAAIGAEIVGPPFARYRSLDTELREFEVEAGFPVRGDLTESDEVDVSLLPAGPAAVAVHVGPYDAMGPTYEALAEFLKEQHAQAMGSAWEVYVSEPDEEPDPAQWRTEIVQSFTA